MARASSIMYAVAATVLLAFVALAPWEELPRSELRLLAVPGYVAAVGVHLAGSRLPVALHHVLAAAGVFLITTAVYLAGTTPAAVAFTLLYVWVALFAFTFFSVSAAVAHTVLALVCGGTVLALAEPATAPAIWLLVLATVLVCGGTTGWLVRKVRRLAQTDALTGVPNRRVLWHVLEREGARAARDATTLSLVALDLDGFKLVNDQQGHSTGDRLLRATAEAWAGQLRQTDLLARYGGDEFTVVLPATTLAQAEGLADRLRGSTPAPVTCSAGVTAWDGSETLDSALVRADRALYEAKRRGRDRTVVHGARPDLEE